MVRFVIRYSLSPFRDWLNRDYGLITRAHGKSVCWLIVLDVLEEVLEVTFLVKFSIRKINPQISWVKNS